MSKRFIKNKEDFNCAKCGREVIGTGYTNHCPECLWSRHVDIFPGDRENSCRGLMEPIGLEKKADSFLVVHRCEACGEVSKTKTVPEDNIGDLLSSML